MGERNRFEGKEIFDMGNPARYVLLLVGVLVGGLGAAASVWYVSSGDTTSVLAALVEQTPTPVAAATLQPTPTDRKQAKQQEKQAQKGMSDLRGAFGVIAGVSGNTLTVKDAQGSERTFTLDATTQLFVVGKTSATIANMVVGDKVLVLGATGTTTLAPRVVISAPASYDVKNVLAGRVTTAGATGIEVETRDTTVEVALATGTQILNAQLATVSASMLKTKAPVLILGEPVGTDQFNAQLVVTLPSGRDLQAQRKAAKTAGKVERKATKQAGKPSKNADTGAAGAALHALPNLGAFGTVSTISGNDLTVQPEVARNFTLDATTKIIAVGKPNATASDITAGAKILVIGGGQNGKHAPTAVLVAPASYTIDNVALGKIMTASATGLELKTRTGNVTVNLDAGTQIFGDGLKVLTSADLAQGRGVVVIGVKNTDGSVQAQVIFMPASKK